MPLQQSGGAGLKLLGLPFEIGSCAAAMRRRISRPFRYFDRIIEPMVQSVLDRCRQQLTDQVDGQPSRMRIDVRDRSAQRGDPTFVTFRKRALALLKF